jgi:hypothetical protein
MKNLASLFSKGLIAALLLVSVVCVAQTEFPTLPTDLTPQNYLLKVSTYIFTLLIFISTIVAQFVPAVAKIQRKWFIAAAVATAIGSMFIYLGKTDTTQALWAFVLSGGIWEFMKLFKQSEIPETIKEIPEEIPDLGEEPDVYDPSNDDIADTATAEIQSAIIAPTQKKRGRPAKN